MNVLTAAKRALRPLTRPLSEWLADRLGAILGPRIEAGVRQRLELEPAPGLRPEERSAALEARVLSTARAIAASGDFRILLPIDSEQRPPAHDLAVGLFGNLANNSFVIARCLRRLGVRADAVIEDGFFDTFPMNRPYWEDVDVECACYDEALAHETRWRQPPHVIRVGFDAELQQRFQGRTSAIAPVQELYERAFGVTLPADRALLLAQQMGHWPYLLAMNAYDVVHFSDNAICMAPFCPRPYVVYPCGGDLYIVPFQETLFGLLTRAGYRGASELIVGARDYEPYLDRLGTTAPRSLTTVPVDTELYRPEDAGETRERWRERAGGSKFLLSVCRQSWRWKGSDRLLRAFARFSRERGRDWRLVLMEWGTDVERSRALIAELGVADRVLWEPLSSKPALRRRQQAADLVADNFVMPSYGTSVVESMAVGTAVVMASQDDSTAGIVETPPPVIAASSEEEIHAALVRSDDEAFLRERARECLRWTVEHHGYRTVARNYLDAYARAACSQPRRESYA